MKSIKSMVSVVSAIALLLVLFSHPAAAFGADIERNTPSPSGDISILGFFDPNNKYLEQGDSRIADSGKQTVIISMNTIAYSSVDSLGANIQLQKWDGNKWGDVGPESKKSKNKDYLFYSEVEKTVTKGYYYRVKSTHWTKQNNVYEEGTFYSSSILIK